MSLVAGFPAAWAFEATKLLLVVANPLGECFDGRAQMTDLRSEPRHRPWVVAARPVFFDHTAQRRVAIEAGPTDARESGDRCETDFIAFAEEVGTRSFHFGQCLG
jgi:hypothetical protein